MNMTTSTKPDQSSRPHVICHMATSIDGRTLPDRWRPTGAFKQGIYEEVHQQFGSDAWLIGRTTGAEFAEEGTTYPDRTTETFSRTAWQPKPGAKSYAIVLDAHGKIAWGINDIGGDPIVVVLTEQVSDAHLVGLRADGVGYCFAGKQAIDIPLALRILHNEMRIERLMLEGGGEVNGAFLRAGVVDEVSVLVIPVVDGAKGAPSLFDSRAGETTPADAVRTMRLDSCQALDGGVVWLRYSINAVPANIT